ncbi:unnamed protein product [Durusdinium trenchii]|uniref:Uncharacterized protein n=1 Tax=Durusdinium trenchii TaxID=1381693 RepID=A0ABP0QBH9_9DINO
MTRVRSTIPGGLGYPFGFPWSNLVPGDLATSLGSVAVCLMCWSLALVLTANELRGFPVFWPSGPTNERLVDDLVEPFWQKSSLITPSSGEHSGRELATAVLAGL